MLSKSRVIRTLTVGLAAAMAMALSSFSVAQAAPSDVVSSFTLTSDDSTTILAGQTATVYWDIAANAGNTEALSAPVVTVTVPSQCVASVNPSAMSSVTPTVDRQTDQYVVSWALSSLPQSAHVPVIIATREGVCPDQQTIPVSAAVTDSTGDVLKANDGDPLDITITAGDPTITTDTPDMLGRSNPPISTVYGGKSDDNGAHLSTSLDDVTWVVFQYGAGWRPGSTAGRNFSSVVVRDTLPNGAVFDAAKNPGWVVSDDGTYADYTYDGNIIRSDLTTLLYSLRLYLKFPGAATNQTMTNTVMFIGSPINPSADEKAYTASGDEAFQLVAEWDPSGVLTKRVMSSSVYDVSLSRDDGVRYLMELTNVALDAGMAFDVSEYSELSPNKPSNDQVGQDLDARLYYDSLVFRSTYLGTAPRWLGQVDVSVCRNGGPATLLTTVDIPSGNTNFPVPLSDGPSITCLEIMGHDGAMIDPGQALTWEVDAKFRDPTVSALANDQSTWLYNTVYGDVRWSDDRSNA